MTLNEKDMKTVRKYMSMSDEERNLERIVIQNEMANDDAHKLMLLDVANDWVQRAHRLKFYLELQDAFN